MSMWQTLDDAIYTQAVTDMGSTATLPVKTFMVAEWWDGKPVDENGNAIQLPLMVIGSHTTAESDVDEYGCTIAPNLTVVYKYLLSVSLSHADRRQAKRDAQTMRARLIGAVKALYPLTQYDTDDDAVLALTWHESYIQMRGPQVLTTSPEKVWLATAYLAFDFETTGG